jgi:hypothetical protein
LLVTTWRVQTCCHAVVVCAGEKADVKPEAKQETKQETKQEAVQEAKQEVKAEEAWAKASCTLTDLDKENEESEFWSALKEFKANLNNHIEVRHWPAAAVLPVVRLRRRCRTTRSCASKRARSL